MSLLKHEINESIRNNEFFLGMKPKLIYNKNFQKIGKFGHSYNSIRTQMMRTMNKQYPPNIKTFDEIPDESEYFKTIRGEDFMIFKNSNVVIFQSPFQAKIYSQYNEDIFVDGTFSIAPKFGYQVKENNFEQFLKFLEYFEKTYIINFKINEWNYYNCIEHITNNASESFNDYLNYLIPSKPNFYRLVNVLREEENVSYLEYENKDESI
eukprot:jgi/Orpsp1_1/1184085/evm.model.c7180000087964.1